ncbi:MAG: Proline--tRNA ligase [candidate division WS6 bacterium OLB20]|uniref:Proline--tRNA ligase n=1 Tax=candidate division WS6 bacterium OLB20 TaxID=1617426 RepID=A0A136M096_9BACT|nr:MAG: Proline--tRNA ligase [candidate division WS6 bacterium OLB20]
MRYSQLFGRTSKESKQYDSKNATLLTKAGFIDQTMAGVYKYLPLGLRVLTKIENIVRTHMDEIGQELLMTALAPKELWEKTGRLGIDVLMETRGANDASRKQNDASYILNPTHEDNITPLVAQFVQSYRELPVALYQIQNKFRNEARPKSGLLRGREFRMKDLYSFHVSKDDLMSYYEVAKQAYVRTFEALGIGDKTVIALASGGDFTENFSHEFQTFCEAGEDLLFYDEKTEVYYNREVTPSQAPAVSYPDNEMKERAEVLGEGIIGVLELAEFLQIPVEQTTKTMLFVADEQPVAVAVRGGYEVDEGKLKKVLGTRTLRMATDAEVEAIGSKVGYVGILDLPEHVRVIIDESCDNRLNFECGANRENYHTVNVNWGRDIQKPEQFYDIKVAQEGDINPATKKPYPVHKAAEVGNIFPLETKFSDAFGFTYTDESGASQKVYMGSYGIGTTRLVGVIAEVCNDERGLVWPKQIAPFQVHLVTISKGEDEAYKVSENIYGELSEQGIEVLWDDRIDVRAGEQFADADLIGNPVRIVVSQKTLEQKSVELKLRSSEDTEMVALEDLVDQIKTLI